MIGAGLVFSGFLILGFFGENYQSSNIETSEFANCFKYSEDNEPISIDCSEKIFSQNIFFAIVIGIIAIGVIFLIKGVRGVWDSKVKPEDMVGPGKNNRVDGKDS
jgi:hypothetical protein